MEQKSSINIEQAKLLSSALRIKIISELVKKPKTAKQVADDLGQSAGNIHYHIKKLYEGGILELVEEKQVRGLTEKYYQSKSKWFNTDYPGIIDPLLSDNFKGEQSTAISIRLNLSPRQKHELERDFKELMEKWVEKTTVDDSTQEFGIGVKIVSTVPTKRTRG